MITQKNLIIVIGYIGIVMNLYFSFSFGILSVQKIGIDNIHLNGILMNFAGLLGFVFSSFLIRNYPRKILHYIHIIGIIFSGVVLFLLDLQFSNENMSVKGLKSIFSCKIIIKNINL